MTVASDDSTSKSPASVLLALLDKASAEIDTYRQRQITTFREAVIVQALITWGANQLKLQSNYYIPLIRFAAALGCLSASIIGYLIIRSYKRRIYYIRGKREALVERIQRNYQSDPKEKVIGLFYPTT